MDKPTICYWKMCLANTFKATHSKSIAKAGLLIILALIAQLAIASEALHKITLEEGIVLSVQKIKSNRSLPHSFYDQAISSIKKLYPDNVLYAKKRFGHLGKMVYSVVCYKENNNSRKILITGTAVLDNNAWSFESRVPDSSFGNSLLIVLDAIQGLPANKAFPPTDNSES